MRRLHNGEAFAVDELPVVSMADWRRQIIESRQAGQRLAALFGAPDPADAVRLIAVLADAAGGDLGIVATIATESYPALTPEYPAAHWFEREIAEQWGIRPEGHPWLKPIRFHRSWRAGHDVWGRAPETQIEPGVTDYFKIAGAEAHEVAVGPVHAGIIEPGHFRFQCHGETVFHLEISLGYQHRGVEQALLGGPDRRAIHLIETLAGDTTIGHTLAYCSALEALSAVAAPPRAQAVRAIALELERLANHAGDLGALAGDVAYLPTASFCGRIRGDLLNMTGLLCGNRFGRGLITPGGVTFDLEPARADELRRRLDLAERDLKSAIELLWRTPSVLARFENTGVVERAVAVDLNLVGPAARACGVERDIRRDHPAGIYRFFQMPVSVARTGDVFARAYVRWLEIQRSIDFIRELLARLPDGSLQAPPGALQPGRMAVALTEGWRGEIVHVAQTDAAGRFARYKIVDPSFKNWFGLALALRGEAISDFPLCNKSFNLSYCGHDL